MYDYNDIDIVSFLGYNKTILTYIINVMNINKVLIDKKAIKDLRKIPSYIIDKLNTWILMVEEYGILEVRKIKSYHDEPLQWNRKGQRSIRLNKAYRAFYVEHDNGKIEISHLEIIEVNKHEY